MLSMHLFVVVKFSFKGFYCLRFCTKYDTWFSKYRIELKMALSSTNATKLYCYGCLLLPYCITFRYKSQCQTTALERNLFSSVVKILFFHIFPIQVISLFSE